MRRYQGLSLPAVYHQWACIGWALGFDLPDKPQQASGMVGDAMVWPAGEVELSDLSDFMNASLQSTVSHSREETKEKTHKQVQVQAGRERLPKQA